MEILHEKDGIKNRQDFWRWKITQLLKRIQSFKSCKWEQQDRTFLKAELLSEESKEKLKKMGF